MKLFSALVLATTFAAACSRQAVVTSSGGEVVSVTPANGNILPAGSVFTASLNQSLGTRSNRVGDRFSATVTNSLVAQNGEVVVPNGARVYGHITGLESRTVNHPALIRLAFDSLTMNGRRYFYDASVMTTAPAGQTIRSTNRAVTDVVGGALAGAAIGAVLSGGELDKILVGTAIGAAAGTVISLGTGDVETVLPAGTQLQLRTTQTVAIR
jgi:hypothetical protein